MTPGEALHPKLAAEFLGTFFLLMAVVGSGIMGERLAGGNEAIALLVNALATAAILVVFITMLGPVSGAHFNPAVTASFLVQGSIPACEAVRYISAQITGAFAGVVAAHAMFDVPLFGLSRNAHAGWAQGLSEAIATFGLITTIRLTLSTRPQAVAASVGLYIGSAYWFTASTSFANPAATLARAFSDTFAGINLADVPMLVAAQVVGACAACVTTRGLISSRDRAGVR